MDLLLFILATLGFVACLRLVLHAGFRWLRGGVDLFLSSELGAAHARRGDLTAVQAAEDTRQRARRSRRGATVRLVLSIGLLVVPMFTPWPAWVFAAYAPLWLVFLRARPRAGS
jgi:hypothetical protein